MNEYNLQCYTDVSTSTPLTLEASLINLSEYRIHTSTMPAMKKHLRKRGLNLPNNRLQIARATVPSTATELEATEADIAVEVIDIDIGEDRCEEIGEVTCNDAFDELLENLEAQSPVSILLLQNSGAKAGSHLRTFYTGSSRMTQDRRRKANEALEEDAKSCQRIDIMFKRQKTAKTTTPPIDLEPENPADDVAQQVDLKKPTPSVMEEAIAKLDAFLGRVKNASSEVGKAGSQIFARHAAVYRYLKYRHGGMRKIEAATMVVKGQAGSQTDYASRMVRELGEAYLATGSVPASRQGKHVKSETILSEEDVKKMCLAKLRTTDPKFRKPQILKSFIESSVYPEVYGRPGTIAEETVRKYMLSWGFRQRQQSQNVYYDGHERADVVE